MSAAAKPNPHEWYHRTLNVALIVAFVPAGATRAENEDLARQLAAYSKDDRNHFATAACGRKVEPSEITWDFVVRVVRERALPIQTQGDAHARAVPFLRVLAGGGGP